METAVKRLYEGMFLVDSTQASDWDRVVKTIKKLLDRSDAEIVTIRNWAEKKLAYEINHKSRGTYVLCYFKADTEKIKNIEKDVRLSEQIMRVLILGTESREKQDIEKDMHGLPEVKRESTADEPAEETTSPEYEAEQADEPEQFDAPVLVDTGEPEQSDEPVAADENEAEQPIMPEAAGASEPEEPAEPESEDVIEPEQPAAPEASDATEPQQPQTEQEPKEPDKKRFFNW